MYVGIVSSNRIFWEFLILSNVQTYLYLQSVLPNQFVAFYMNILYIMHHCIILSFLSVLNEQAHEIMALFVLRKLIFQTRNRSHPVWLDFWFLVGPFVYFHTSCMRTAKALARLCGSLVAYVISTIISWAGSNFILIQHQRFSSSKKLFLI